MKNPVEIFLVFGFLVILTRAIITALHELGHAIPLVIMTKDKATIYLGSYGDKNKCFNITCGSIDIWAKINPLLWYTGLCVPHAKQVSNTKSIIYILGGPLMSLFIACISISVLLSHHQEDWFKLILFVFAIISVLDFIYNMIPNNRPIKMLNGSITHNDGQLIRSLIKSRKFPINYHKAVQLYTDKMYAESAPLFEEFLSSNTGDANTFRYIISSYLQSKNFEKAKEWNDQFINKFQLNANDYCSAGLIYAHFKLYDKAFNFYDKSIELDPKNFYSLNNIGYELGVMGKYEESLPFLDEAILANPEFGYSYNNRGLAKIKTGNMDGGLKDIMRSIQLDPSNSYGYRNLGIYYLEKKEYDKALEQFNKSKALDEFTHNLDALILETQTLLQNKL